MLEASRRGVDVPGKTVASRWTLAVSSSRSQTSLPTGVQTDLENGESQLRFDAGLLALKIKEKEWMYRIEGGGSLCSHCENRVKRLSAAGGRERVDVRQETKR
jgi:hypothetical protein